MALDKMYYVNKNRFPYGYRLFEFGEIQNTFNMSLVCDVTKDSCKVIVYNNDSKELDPITLVYLESTNTWWVVRSDKVVRYANEVGGYYQHSISLYGAFEILNYRDLINCGFNANRYTLEQMLTRLISLTDFEFNVEFEMGEFADMQQKITYLKTFQNYTPASAIKELFNGMNLVPKMTFDIKTSQSGDIKYIDTATIYPVSKSGNNNEIISVDTFDDEEEISSSNIESFGTRVVSNVQNCVCADPIRFPAFGGAKLTSNDAQVKTGDQDNAILRLPNDVYDAKKVIIYFPIRVKDGQNEYTFPSYDFGASLINWLKTSRIPAYIPTQEEIEELKERIEKFWVGTIKSGGVYNGIDGSRTGDWLRVYSGNTLSDEFFAFNSQQYAKTSLYTWDTITWEQGKNYLSNVRIVDRSYLADSQVELGFGPVIIKNNANTSLTNTGFAVEYIPMADLKVKVDNQIAQNDTQLYNQNGKFIDSVAISKLINSHSVEISSNEITRYKTFRSFEQIPQVSQRVNVNGEIYIINNVSIDFYENDDDKYYMNCQFTMTKNVACKSTMISANTNIRDYDCPQQNNVQRTQTYRDYIEFGYNAEHNDTPYLDLSKNLDFTSSSKGINEPKECVFKIELEDIGNFYYHIPSVRYNLNKQYIEHIDFKDNNIIGYEAGKSYYVFQIQTLLNRKSSLVNTPISYVDNFGEAKSIELKLLSQSQLIDSYVSQGGSENDFDTSVITNFVSVPEEVYEYIDESSSRYDIEINEPNYDKDGLEVPVFEYACQVGDANGIVFGADFLKGRTGHQIKYFYKVFNETDIITQENATRFMFVGNEMTPPSFANNELTLSLTNNTTQILGKNLVFWCEIYGDEEGSRFGRYETNVYYSNGENTITFQSHGENSIFTREGYTIVNPDIVPGSRANIISTTTNSITYTIGSNEHRTITIDGKLKFVASTPTNTNDNVVIGASPTVIEHEVEGGSTSKLIKATATYQDYISGQVLYFAEGYADLDVDLTDKHNISIVQTAGNEHNTFMYASQNRVFYRVYTTVRNGLAIANITITYNTKVYETNYTISNEKTKTINQNYPITITPSNIDGFDNTANVVPYVEPGEILPKYLINGKIYSYDAHFGETINVSYVYNQNVSREVAVSGNGLIGEQVYNLGQRTLVGTPSISIDGDYIDPIVNIIDFDTSTGELTYEAYDNGDPTRQVGVKFAYSEIYEQYELLATDFLFAINSCKASGTNQLKLKVNNWKLK